MSDKSILITGTTNGLGKEFKDYFLNKKYKIISINKIGSNIKNFDNYINFNIDIENLSEVVKLIHLLKSENKIPDIFILNAGINIYDNVDQFNVIEFKKCFDINFFGTMHFVHALENSGILNKTIIFISSTSNIIPNPAALGYYSSKLLLLKLSKYLNLNKNNFYKVMILGPVKTKISRNLNQPYGLSRVIYNFLVISTSTACNSLEKFIFNKNKFFYFTKFSVFIYSLLSLFLFFFPFLYKGGKTKK
jgi:3-oxoacyl-[acyl-carrier protein] reductase